MTDSELHVLVVAGVAACWGAIALVWIAGAMYNASRGPRERTRRQLGSSAVIGAVLVWAILRAVPGPDWHGLAVRTPWVQLPGLALLVASTAFALWARVELGTMWSSAPMVKDDHRLRTDGPYGITRHPIYTGLLGMMLGTVLLVGFGHWVVIFPVGLGVVLLKIRIEEGLMLTTFPEDYPRYRGLVPRLVPRLRGLRRAGVPDS